MSIRPGARLGIDVGTVRIGVAVCDIHAMLATPLATVARGTGDVSAVIRLIDEHQAMEVVVGLPLALSGSRTASTADAVGFAGRLAAASAVPVRLVDERLSTVSAQRALRSTGRDVRRSRPVIDQVAATIILQHALDFERSSGTPPGERVALDEG